MKLIKVGGKSCKYLKNIYELFTFIINYCKIVLSIGGIEMKKLTGEEIIRTYIEFFKERDHMEVESAPLIPHNDKSVLWINAGVTPLKKYFDGSEIPSNRRIVSCQKCIRTGDIEVVGKTARHHTFFQMLGNFSVGDYFKKEALTWALELLTSEKYFGMDKDKLYVTIYPTDNDACEIWKSLGVDESHIIKLEGNYWEIGEGPSGPDSEIFYDRGEAYDKDKLGVKLLADDIENDRYIEIWNNVFSQYNAKEGVDRKDYEELPSKNIDTGMGVERMACILQETETNYETDLFIPIMDKISEISKIRYMGQMEFKVIADHIRTLTFAIADGATFENFGRGYVIRRLLRRAVRMGRKLKINKSFMSELVDVVVDKYSNIYPYLVGKKDVVKSMINEEEELFQKTLLAGEKRFNEIIKNNDSKIINGEDAFKLYDTYGFPVELTIEMALELGYSVDKDSFDKYMLAQKEMARNSRKVENSMNLQNEALMNFHDESKFVGYDVLENETEVIAIIKDDIFVDSISDSGYIVLKECPFYAESGGQVADLGYIKSDNFKARVVDVIKAPNKQHLVEIEVMEGSINKGSVVLTHVMRDVREDTCKNHSSVHLLHKTLQEFLGESAQQAGSKVDSKRSRLDFTYHGRLSDDIIVKIEEEVNNKIKAGSKVVIESMSLEEAKKKGAMALFEDKYGDVVRVVSMGNSIELCGGTHVKNTADINKFAIISVENKGADTFRIEASTDKNISEELFKAIKPYNDEIMKLLNKAKKIVKEASEYDLKLRYDFNIKTDDLDSYLDIVNAKKQIDDIKLETKRLEKEFNDKKIKKSIESVDVFVDSSEVINDMNVLITITEDYDIPVLKQLVDAISNKLDKSFVLLANVGDNNVNFICKNNTGKESINAGAIIKDLALACNGNGGGSKVYAQGGGTNPDDIVKNLGNIKEKLKEL